MQVTRDNFPAVFPKFVELLQSCDFVAFDEEMTGINMSDSPECITDTPEESYRCKRAVASRYNIIQVGICLFHKDDEHHGVGGGGGGGCGSVRRYVARPFNFILFPSHNEDTRGEERMRDVVWSPSSISFLRRHGMDFQSWVYRGVGYCNAAQEEILVQGQEEKHRDAKALVGVGKRGQEQGEAQGMDLMTVDERKWFEDALSMARALSKRANDALSRARAANTGHTGGGGGGGGEGPACSVEVAAMLDLLQTGGREVFLPPQRSRNAREQLERRIACEFDGELVLTFRRRGGVFSGTLCAAFPEELARLEEKARSMRERETIDMLGFRLVFKALVANRKPCVGHNCFADLLFLLASLDRPLPESLVALKRRILELFPVVFDTKYIANRQDLFPLGRFGSRYLNGYFEEYGFRSANVHVRLPLGFEAYDPLTTLSGGGSGSGGEGAPLHEAGYDALLTGTLFLNLLAEIGHYEVSSAAKGGLMNRVALFRSLYAVRLDSPDGEDEFLLNSDSGRRNNVGVLDLRHEKSVKCHHIDGCFLALPLRGVTLHSVSETRTLAILPAPPSAITDDKTVSATTGNCPTAETRTSVCGDVRGWEQMCRALTEADVGRFATLLTSRFPQYFEATPYHHPAGIRRSGGAGGLHPTPRTLMRAAARFVLR